MTLSQKRNIQVVTVAAVVIVFILFLVFLTLIIQKTQLKNVKSDLDNQLKQLSELETKLNSEQEYRQTLEYIENYAREKLGMISAWETLWKSKET